jgi:hypothetical protein
MLERPRLSAGCLCACCASMCICFFMFFSFVSGSVVWEELKPLVVSFVCVAVSFRSVGRVVVCSGKSCALVIND